MEYLTERLRNFLHEHVLPVENQLISGRDDGTLRALQLRARDAGLWALPLPEHLGGAGLSLTEYAELAVLEGHSDAGPAVFGSDLLLDATMLDLHGGPSVHARYLRPMVAGDAPPSFAMTEPGRAGSDPASMATTAVRDGGAWVLTGRKWFVSRAATAAFTTVACRTPSGISLIVVPSGAPGWRIVREVPVLGAGGQYELALERVRVPVDHLLGAEGEGLAVAGERLALGRTLRCLRWLGQAQRAFDLMLERMRGRHVRGGVLADRQLLHRYVFDSHADLLAAASATRLAVDALARGTDPRTAVGTAKVLTARAFDAVVDRAIQIHGAEGLSDDTPLAMLHRSARAARILDGPDETHVTAVARRLLAVTSPPPAPGPG
ncbi:acyl-CoA dehydrogenase family protein [Actinoplanes sp. NPDC051346]|uniref:acyl-CoA dehydrogenase family protein n=1 Tax=Actinoplanes sp. NPDC051346 TaxID=3155048 RepID=UPI00342D1E80